jgi:hypothetical protein
VNTFTGTIIRNLLGWAPVCLGFPHESRGPTLCRLGYTGKLVPFGDFRLAFGCDAPLGCAVLGHGTALSFLGGIGIVLWLQLQPTMGEAAAS